MTGCQLYMPLYVAHGKWVRFPCRTIMNCVIFNCFESWDTQTQNNYLSTNMYVYKLNRAWYLIWKLHWSKNNLMWDMVYKFPPRTTLCLIPKHRIWTLMREKWLKLKQKETLTFFSNTFSSIQWCSIGTFNVSTKW